MLFLLIFLTRGLAELFFRVWQSRRMHHRSQRRRKVARLCVPHLRGSPHPSTQSRSGNAYSTERPSVHPPNFKHPYNFSTYLPRTDRPETRDSALGASPQYAIFRWRSHTVSYSTADSMRAFFSKYGKVVDATVMVDRETGRSEGTCICHV
ncbi:hypothetical protein EI94DRAFT_1271602 [Lactarius quietus]|nr:hypothetical protein EI94DRAFT_1271602 [Lactarius quietus]